jgi:hypothetical protein
MLLMQRTSSCSVARVLTVEMIASLRPSCLHENTAWWFFPRGVSPLLEHYCPAEALKPALSGSLASFRQRSKALPPRIEDNTKAESHLRKLYRFVDVVKSFSLLGVPVVLEQKTTILWKRLYLLAFLKDSPGLGEA